MTKQIKRKTLILFMVLSVFMTTICSQTSVKAANKVYKNVKLIFEDNQGNTIKTFTKDITQGETLGIAVIVFTDCIPEKDMKKIHR